MSLATLLERNKAFAATDAVAKNPKIPWRALVGAGGHPSHRLRPHVLADPELRRGFAARGGFVEAELAWLPTTDPAATVRADVNTLVSAPQLSPNIMVSGYVYNTAAGVLEMVVEPTPVRKR